MSKKVYNKLVRDRIPEIIAAEGKALKTRILSDEEYLEALIQKMHEELEEFKEALTSKERTNILEELADIQEVILALTDALKIEHKQLAKTLSDKALKRGAFKKRIFLEEAEV